MSNDVIITTNKSYNKNKRQVYIWDEHKDFYDKLPNKSKIINLLIRQYMESNGREIKYGATKADNRNSR